MKSEIFWRKPKFLLWQTKAKAKIIYSDFDWVKNHQNNMKQIA